MKRIILSLAVFLFAAAAGGQVQTPPGVINVVTAPSGACPQGAPGQKDATGNITTCQGPFVAGFGTWTGAAVANYPGVTSDAANGLNVTGTVAATSAVAQTIGATRYASQYGNKTTNGISSAAAANQTVIADPSYPTTEQPGPFSFPVSLHYRDLRNISQSDLFINPYTTTFVMGVYPMNVNTIGGKATGCVYWLLPASWSGSSLSENCDNTGYVSNTPGWSIGNPSGFAAGAANGWQSSSSKLIATMVRGAGIGQSLTINHTKTSVGDNIPQYNYLTGSGGQTAPSDEGNKGYATHLMEDTGSFTATCNSGCTTGSTLIHTSVANGTQGVGRYLIDTTPGAAYTGHFTSISGSTITVDATVPVSNARGTLATAVSTPVNVNPSFTTSETFNVNITSGTFDTTHLVCFGGNFHEQTIPTAVGTPSGGVQSITIPLQYPHINGSAIFQGSPCGYGLEATSYTYNGLRYLFDVLGSTDAHTLTVVAFAYGASSGTYIPASTWQTFGVLSTFTCTDSGGSLPNCSGTYQSGVGNLGLGHPSTLSALTFVTSGFSDSALNGNCTGSAWTIDAGNNQNFTCTKTGVTGTHTTTTTGSVGLGLNSFNLWPMAEVLDVQNEALSPPQVDGTLALEPNVIAFSAGDTVYETHHHTAAWTGTSIALTPQNPFDVNTNGLIISMTGKGIAGGATSATSNAMLALQNNEPSSSYMGYGGILTPPNGINITGLYNIGFDFGTSGPANGQPLINVQPDSTQMNNPSYSFATLNIPARAGAMNLIFTPYSGDYTISSATHGNLHLSGGDGTGGGGSTAGVIVDTALTVKGAAALNGSTTTTTQTCATNNTTLATTAYVNTCAQKVGVTAQQIGGVALGSLINYGQNSATMTGAGWSTGGTVTVTGGQAAPTQFGGTNAIQIVDAVGNSTYQNTGGPMISGTNYTACGYMRGTTGSEQVSTYVGNIQSQIFPSTAWAIYTISGSPTSNLTTPITFQTRGTITVYMYGWNLVPTGTPCLSPGLPTGDAAQTTALNAVAIASNLIRQTIASGTAVMTTATISAGACGTTVTVPATGVLTTDTINWSGNAAPSGTNAGIYPWPTAGNVNFAYCPGVAETPAAATINWSVTR